MVLPIRRSQARLGIFAAMWSLTTAGLAWLVAQGQRQFDAGIVPAMLAILACTATLLWWLPGPALPQAAKVTKTRRGRLALAGLLALVLLCALRNIVGPPLLFGLPVVALLVLIAVRPRLERREVLYTLALAGVAAVAGLALGSAKFPPLVWAALQVALVVPCLLAGWSILRREGLWQAGLGGSLLLGDGRRPALQGAVQGAILGAPWALFNVAMGGANNDAWVRSWWQPLAALQPGIAEEAWGRVFLIPLLFVILRRFAGARAALMAAVVVIGYWFAYLHTPGGLSLSTIFSTLLIGTIYCLPITFVWLRQGLEPAMGFHFWQDFFRFGVAYLVNGGMWFGM